MHRRHVHDFEVPDIIAGLRLRLLEYLETKDNLLGAEIAFRAYYRLMESKRGRPDYPEPVTWGLIEDFCHLEKGTFIDLPPLEAVPRVAEEGE